MRIVGINLPRRAQRSVVAHRHDHVEWHFAVAGQCGFEVNGSDIDLVAGDLLAIASGCQHRLHIRHPGEWLIQIIIATASEGPEDEALYTTFIRQSTHNGLVHAGGNRHALFAGIAHDHASADPIRRRGASLRFTAALCDLVTGTRSDGDPAVARALAVMRSRLRGRLSLSELVTATGCGRSILAQRFRAEVGIPPMAHFLGMRLDLAAELLRGGDRRVHEVAAAIGFDDPYHFSRCFTKRFGTSPSTWMAR
jgi:AraC-like DNA-binding protein